MEESQNLVALINLGPWLKHEVLQSLCCDYLEIDQVVTGCFLSEANVSTHNILTEGFLYFLSPRALTKVKSHTVVLYILGTASEG
jgi:hypothetical protein